MNELTIYENKYGLRPIHIVLVLTCFTLANYVGAGFSNVTILWLLLLLGFITLWLGYLLLYKDLKNKIIINNIKREVKIQRVSLINRRIYTKTYPLDLFASVQSYITLASRTPGINHLELVTKDNNRGLILCSFDPSSPKVFWTLKTEIENQKINKMWTDHNFCSIFTYKPVQFLCLLSLCLIFSHQSLAAQCNVATNVAKNADGSSIQLSVSDCEGDSNRAITVSYRSSGSSQYRSVLQLNQDATESPTGGAKLLDLDRDGLHEMELRGMCGAGPNCEGSIYRLTPDRAGMFLFFSGGYAQLTGLDGYLVESGRASCCAWEHHVYQPRSTFTEVQASDMVYRVVVGTTVNTDTEDAATCTFFDQQERVVLPASQKLLQLCDVYGPDYILAKPDASAQ